MNDALRGTDLGRALLADLALTPDHLQTGSERGVGGKIEVAAAAPNSPTQSPLKHLGRNRNSFSLKFFRWLWPTSPYVVLPQENSGLVCSRCGQALVFGGCCDQP